jgi:SnoaL-like protein
MLEFVDPDVEWTYLDPGLRDPEPQVCYGRDELERALARQAEQGLRSELEEVIGGGDRVVVVVRTPGVDAHRARKDDDQNLRRPDRAREPDRGDPRVPGSEQKP